MILIAGKPAGNVICSEAKTQKVDLVITGCRGLSKARRTILGSVSDYVVHHSGLPVCVVPPPLKKHDQWKISRYADLIPAAIRHTAPREKHFLVYTRHSFFINVLITESEGHTREYWPEVHTKMAKGRYSQVQLEQVRLVSSYNYMAPRQILFIFNLQAFPNLNKELSVWQNPDQVRANQNDWIYLRISYVSCNVIKLSILIGPVSNAKLQSLETGIDHNLFDLCRWSKGLQLCNWENALPLKRILIKIL